MPSVFGDVLASRGFRTVLHLAVFVARCWPYSGAAE